MTTRGHDLIPVNLITGFLGSGKTTLLQRLLEDPGLGTAAVLINEFGEVGIDHHLIQRVDEATVLLKSGCLCCTIRGDLRDAIRDLYDRRERGEVPSFDRLVIETTGLADPAPIVATLTADPVICHHFRLGNIITVVDAKNGSSNLASFQESRRQVAVADRLVVSKTDITAATEVVRLRAELNRLNGAATAGRCPKRFSCSERPAGRRLRCSLQKRGSASLAGGRSGSRGRAQETRVTTAMT